MGESPEDGGVMRRKRVAKACETCRSMKSKCDGKQPECSRCSGYGYHCVYPENRRRHRTTLVPSLPAEVQDKVAGDLCQVIDQYEALLDELIPQLATQKLQDEATRNRATIKSQADRAVSYARQPHGPASTSSSLVAAASPPLVVASAPSPTRSPGQNQRYLGEVSDVRFFNFVKRVLQTRNLADGHEQEFDSYEQDGDLLPPPDGGLATVVLDLPDHQKASKFLDIYFSTIHIAYPFVPESAFMTTYNTLRDSSDKPAQFQPTWLGLFYVLCAIGAYYTSFPGKEDGEHKLHEVFFLRALSLAPPAGSDRSIDQVALLLAQCFYYLAVCRTDSCWTTLGLAVRTAQSIGLHVENEGGGAGSGSGGPVKATSALETERRRRLWYSIYVLDRLLALQLGRPPAIHDDDCYVPLPSRVSDSEIHWDGDELPAADDDRPSRGDYFIAVIRFSRIVGHVLRDLYSPRKRRPTTDDLLSTKHFDKQLLDWKLALPRTLRFDLGHAFEKCVAFRRQRNMLAVKFHHLRALIHRPYLCYPLLRHLDDASTALSQTDWPLVSMYERTCVQEARETAHLMHNVSSEKVLVHDFPWWQMISCLICAGSILLVSSIFTKEPAGPDDPRAEFDAAGLYDDAETCLKVFEALSANSSGARIARDMMRGLKECGIKWRETMVSSQDPEAQPGATFAAVGAFGPAHGLINTPGPMMGPDCGGFVPGDEDTPLPDGVLLTPNHWPAEIVDSMAWSAQFFGAMQNS